MDSSKGFAPTTRISEVITSKNSLKNMKLNAHKAGMEGLDTERINEIILEASKGSKFYQHKQERQKQLESKIESLKEVAATFSHAGIQSANREMDSFIEVLERERDLSRIIIHVDMDAFYASVEMRDDPSLKDKPMAVGSLGMLSTSNYIARRYGVRAAMPGFIGKKLCPNLVLISPNFEKYTSVSRDVQEIFRLYDPDFSSVGLDEAYLDISDIVDAEDSSCKSRFEIAGNIITEMRSKIFEKTNLTASAGIAPNMLLAKIASDMNKPDGQFVIKPCAIEIKNFIRSLSIRKVSGVGPVCEQQLNGLGVETFNDVYENRGLIHLLFSPTSSKFFIEASLGIGSTVVKSDHIRKSISVERTFAEISDLPEIIEKCGELCDDLVEDMKKHQISAKTITVKLKTVEFQVKTRSFSFPEYICDYNGIFKVATKLITTEQENLLSSRPLKLRLMGVRASNLKFQHHKNKQQPTLTSFISDNSLKAYPTCPVCTKQLTTSSTIMINEHIEQCLDYHAELEDAKGRLSFETRDRNLPVDKSDNYECPVCGKSYAADLDKFNKHVDTCLNNSAIKEIMQEEKHSNRILLSAQPSHKKNDNENESHHRTISSFFKPVSSPQKASFMANEQSKSKSEVLPFEVKAKGSKFEALSSDFFTISTRLSVSDTINHSQQSEAQIAESSRQELHNNKAEIGEILNSDDRNGKHSKYVKRSRSHSTDDNDCEFSRKPVEKIEHSSKRSKKMQCNDVFKYVKSARVDSQCLVNPRPNNRESSTDYEAFERSRESEERDHPFKRLSLSKSKERSRKYSKKSLRKSSSRKRSNLGSKEKKNYRLSSGSETQERKRSGNKKKRSKRSRSRDEMCNYSLNDRSNSRSGERHKCSSRQLSVSEFEFAENKLEKDIKSSEKSKSAHVNDIVGQSHTLKDEKSYNEKCNKRTDRNSTTKTNLKHSEKKHDLPEFSENVYTDIEFVWTDYKSTLNKMFFSDSGFFSRKSKELDDFWDFLKKYQTLQRKRILNGGPEKLGQLPFPPSFDDLEGIPETYLDDIFLKFQVPSLKEDIRDLYFRVHMYDKESQKDLPRARVIEFRYVIHLYVNFCLKQEYNKVKKLRMSQKKLPISYYRDEIVETLKHHQVILVAGDTGCGKSTQVPQYLLRSGYQKIACTQPRRIACISLCKRVSFETLNQYKSEVGYQIRFDKSKTQHTRILFLTEGLLLRQVSTDSTLSSYNVIVLDEVHERHLHGDFLLGVLKCLIQHREDVKIVLMSATINIELFVKYFNSAPVIQVPGRLFPIKVNYRPISVVEKGSKSSKIDPSPYLRILQLIDKTIPDSERGDVLIFLSGIAEISTVAGAAQAYSEQTKRWIILPLHSTLSISEQDKVFDIAPDGVRKCIISTNIAETSITIDGIRFVVDSGKVKEMNYDMSCKMQKLKEFWISRASAEQRKGRAGRTGPGVCYRLYSEKEYDEMSPYSTPELQRVPLDTLILQMLAMGLPDPRKFPFIQPPAASSIENAVLSLIEHGALNSDEILTPIGRMLSMLPVEISIGKMLIMGSLFKMVEPALSLASALSVQSPFTTSSFKNPDAMAARKCHESEDGDPLTLLNTYNDWLLIKADRRESNSRKWCRKRGIEEQRLYEMTKLRRQFKDLLKDCQFLEDDLANHNLSSVERTQRHGEMKHLRKIKHSYHNAPQKRKVLKLNFEFEIGDAVDDDNDDEIDIKDVEFRMSHNNRQMKALVDGSNNVNNADLTILKVIVCSGLFPQIAIVDEHNSCKADSEQLFHTKLKPYVVLHPMGVFANKPEILQLKDAVKAPSKEFSGKGFLSQNHQVLTYVSLLETTKPYLMTTMKISACHTLLLFSNGLDTNEDFSRIVCDRWIELKFVNADEAQKLILAMMEIRDIWQILLQNRLKGKKENDGDEINCKKLERQLSGALIDFYHESRPLYTMKRLLAADIKQLYKGPSESGDATAVSELFQWISDVKPNETKGGIQLKEYVTYNCLVEEDSTYSTQKAWTCKYCEEEIVVTVLERMRHEAQCKQRSGASKQSEDIDEQEPSSTNVIKRPYFCPDCQEELHLTSVQILKHKKTHSLVSTPQ